MTMTKIKPCPFCGGDGVLHTLTIPTPGGHAHIQAEVECKNCDACGPICYGDFEAVLAWNRRHEGEEP
jgi:Lar family restriction alleviation protein